MVIQHNMAAMNANREIGSVKKKQASSTEKLSSGFKINRSADDAAGLSISEKMRYQIRGLEQGQDNIGEGIGYCQTADGALAEMQEMLQRMGELCVEAASDTNSESDRQCINDEIQQLKQEIERICETTKYNEEYIFKCTEKEKELDLEEYDLSFSGYMRDMYIYNDSYDPTTKTAVYGGIAYNGKRYAWATISAAMYDNTTGKFNEGTYTLKADDGSELKLVCESGSKPPEVIREYELTADTSGVYICGQKVMWQDIKTAQGVAFDPFDFLSETYYINYNGMNIGFKPDYTDSFTDVVDRLNGTKWTTKYQVPTEMTAVTADFSNSYSAFASETQVKNWMNGLNVIQDYVLRASDDGIWLERGGTQVAGSLKTWKSMGLGDWGDGSTDIWSDKIYKYSYARNNATVVSFEFSLLNETSKDSVIAAFDNVSLKVDGNRYENNTHADLKLDNSAGSNIISAKVTEEKIDLTLKEEYGLGRDYTTAKDEIGREQIGYDGNTFKVEYSGTKDNNVTQKAYQSDAGQTQKLVEDITNQIFNDYHGYMDIIKERFRAGAKDPNNVELVKLIGAGNITGGGADTHLCEQITLDSSDPNWKITAQGSSANYDNKDYASASIDFSGLGTSYGLADLIGMGFNSTCQTCNNHYSIQFSTAGITNTNWQSATIDGETYRYARVKEGNNYTLYLDVDSMMESGKITNGVELTNTLVDLMHASDYDFHYTQYATKTNDATLYVFDNRPRYATNATHASFSPYAYGFNNTVDFNIRLYDRDNAAENITLNYKYDYSNLFVGNAFSCTADPDNANGEYVKKADGSYERYDDTNPAHQGADRYNLNVSLNTNGQTLHSYLGDFVQNTILKEVSDNSKLSLVSDYARYKISGSANDSAAIVTRGTTPVQIMNETSGIERLKNVLKIQCSSNVKDCLYIEKQHLSLQRLGLKNVAVEGGKAATRSIGAVGVAIKRLNTVRSKFGAYQNRLEHADAVNRNTCENTQASESKIRDTDMADELLEYTNRNILEQIGEAMLAQANKNPQMVVSLLQ